MSNVVEMPGQPKEPLIRCELRIGIKENGEVYMTADGTSADLITIEGLLSYGQSEMKRYWDVRAYQMAQEANAAEA